MSDRAIGLALLFLLVSQLLVSCTGDDGDRDVDCPDGGACADAGAETGADAAVEPSASPIGRDADPVVLTGDDVALLQGRDPADVVAFQYRQGWERVPVQVDERVTVDLARVCGFERFHVRCVAPLVSVV